MIATRTLAALVLAVAATAAAVSGDATQIVPPSRDGFAMRVVATGLANPFQVVWGPDDYLWVTSAPADASCESARRTERRRPS